MKRQPDKKIYLYGRLSHEDELQGDSNSIINQRKILTKYAEDNPYSDKEYFLKKKEKRKTAKKKAYKETAAFKSNLTLMTELKVKNA